MFVHDAEPLQAAAAVAATHLIRHGGLTADEALTQIATLLGATAAPAVAAVLPNLSR
ncbi:MAG: hypothetical protein N2037_10845 [Acidimicrobiales bacterium]|nr:hypothetical protein [Acidimicrobiales bacterium]